MVVVTQTPAVTNQAKPITLMEALPTVRNLNDHQATVDFQGRAASQDARNVFSKSRFNLDCPCVSGDGLFLKAETYRSF